jgi:hypothetical protein
MKAKYPECLNCQRVLIGPARFCSFCGGNQADLAAFFASVQVQTTQPKVEQKPVPEEPKVTKLTPTPPRRKSNKFLFIGLGVLVFLVVAASIGGEDSPTATPSQTTNSSSTSSSAPEEAEPIAVAFSEVADSEIIADRASQTCSALGEIVVPDNNPSFLPSQGAIVIDEVDRIERESTAKNYVSENSSWINDDFLEGYRDSLRGAVEKQLDAAISDLGYTSPDFEIDLAQWSTGFLNKSIEACDLTDQRQETEDAIGEFQDNVNRVIKLSKK